MKRFAVHAVVVAGIAAVLLGLSASPALAGPPPPRALVAGSSMYAVGCSSVGDQLLSMDVSTATATTIGTGLPTNPWGCAGQSAWDAITHTAYYFTWDNPQSLVSLNLSTGDSTTIAGFTVGGAPALVDAIAIGTDGAAYALSSGTLYSLNLATGAMTSIAAVADSAIYGFAVDPTSGTFFTIDRTGLIASIDVATGALTTIGQTSFGVSSDTFSLQIDSNGTMWVARDYVDGHSELWSVDPTDVAGSGVLSGTITVGGTNFYTESLLIVPTIAPAVTSASPAASVVAGAAFSFTVAASGTTPVVFSISAGALPTGLTLDAATGVISGTPTTAGSFTYTVTATNGAGTATASYTQLVTAAPVPTPTPSTIHLPIVSG